MLVITFKGLGNSLRGKTLWQIACLTLIWMVWQERNNRIFEDKGRMEEMSWDLIRFYSSLWASCTEAFKGIDGISIGSLDDVPSGPVTTFFRSIRDTLDFDFEDENEGLFYCLMMQTESRRN
ncbi:Protein low PSII accumulation 3, chloroplastic [Vitis vinifera]|uniref:Protein low PSII accumulation 3, chloroplastic n=1 Tax=Vitis vinifera TaxID=29760 RepID=A0A438HLB5_VITVI|nr:Protein low PSII accumulation 3, chloroplastic [Vitis vinifera]